MRRSIAQKARRIPAMPPRTLSSSVSVSIWRTRLRRPARDGRPHGELLVAVHAARQQQVGNVGARDEQHQAHHAQQRQQERPDVTDDLLVQRCDANAVIRAGLRVLGREPVLDGVHLRLRLAQCRAGTQPRCHEDHRPASL